MADQRAALGAWAVFQSQNKKKIKLDAFLLRPPKKRRPQSLEEHQAKLRRICLGSGGTVVTPRPAGATT